MSFDDEVCDYCNNRYPDKRSLMVHEFIHLDKDIDHFFPFSGISSESYYLPKAKQLFPNGIRNNRLLEINYKKMEMNIPQCGKRYSKMFLVSEAIEELVYLCQKHPVRETPCEKLLECDQMQIADEVPILLCTSPNYSEMIPVYSSDSFSSSSATSSSSESSSDDSESELERKEAENEASSEVVQQGDNQNIHISPDNVMDQVVIKESSSDSGYGSSPQENCSERYKNDSNTLLPDPAPNDSSSTVEINDLLENLVSNAVRSENYSISIFGKSIDPDEFKSIFEKPVNDQFATQQNMKLDFQASAKQGLEVFGSVDKNAMIVGSQESRKVAGKVYSMPHILC